MSKVAKTTVLIMVLTIFSKVLGLVREQVLALSYGTGMYADVYVTAMKIPTILFTALGASIATSLIPVYSKVREEKGLDKSQKFLSNLINIVSIIALVMVVFGMIFTEPLVKVFAFGFEGEKLAITINFVRIILWAVIFIGLNNIITSYLQLNNNFKIPALTGIPYNIIVIISIIISIKTNVYVLIIGSLLALASQVLFQIPAVKKTGLKHSFKVDLKDEDVRYLIILVIPVLIGGGVEQINTLIDGSLASTFGDGVVSAFNYANKLYGFVSAIFVVSILSVVYPMMAKSLASEDEASFKLSIKKTMNIIIIFIIPICVGTMVLAQPIVRVLFERGKFNYSDTIMTANILIVYIIGILAFSLRNLVSKAFYSLHDTKTPMITGSIAIVFNIVLNFILSKYMGYIGLAIATTISAFIGLIISLICLRKKIGGFGMKNILITLIKSTVAACVMGVFTYISYNKLQVIFGAVLMHDVISLGGAIFVGVCIYSIAILLLKVDELDIVLGIVKKRLK
ncbi:murein biosynthesis integral membrane protein MurJ [Romboutsia lituseburensis]|nr:murein biosynthesis integral membrane protein MurJ [Romboutsia lituseburensis]